MHYKRLDNPLVLSSSLVTESLSTRDVRCTTNVVRLDNPLVLSSSLVTESLSKGM